MIPSRISFVSSLTSDKRASFYGQHRVLAVVMILVVFMLPFAGLFLWGVIGVVLGVLISVLGYYLTPYAVLKLFGENRV